MMKKRIFWTTIIILIIGFIVGTTFSYILLEKNFPIVKGIYVGGFVAFCYLVATLFFRFSLNNEKAQKLERILIIIAKWTLTMLIWSGITALITTQGIALKYFWMHSVNLSLAILTIVLANKDSKKINK